MSTTAPPAAPPMHKPAGAGVLDKIKANPKVAGGAVVVLLVVGAGLRARSKTPAAGGSSSAPSTITPGNGGVYDSTATDQFSALSNELADLRNRLDNQQGAAGTTATDTGAALPTAPAGRMQGHQPVTRPVAPASSAVKPAPRRGPPKPVIIVNAPGK